MENNKRNVILIAIIGICVYLNSLNNKFVWDDILLVINNDFIKGPSLIKEIFTKPLFYFANADYVYYRPIQTLSYVFDYSIWNLNPFGFHLTNIALHIFTAFIIYFLIGSLFNDQQLSFFVGLLFVIHPINTSVVNYISSRADILFMLFTMVSLILFIKAKHPKFYFLSLVFFILALLSKETALVFPLCLIFTKEIHLKINKGKTNLGVVRLWYIVFIVTSLMYMLLRADVLRIRTNILVPPTINFMDISLTLSKIIIEYLKLFYLPFDLHMLRNIAILNLADNTIILYMSFALSLLGITLFLLTYRWNKIIFFSWGFFLVWILPIGMVALKNPEYYFQGRAIMEEHWLYIPSVGIFIFTVYLLRKISRRLKKIVYKTVLLLFIIYLSSFTLKENVYWKDNYTLFTHILRYVDNSITVYRNLGWIYLHRGQINKSIDIYHNALNLKQDYPNKAILYRDIAYAYFLNNQIDEAINMSHKALDINYNYADAHGYIGLIYSKDNLKRDKAKEEWKIALDLDPFNPISFNNLLELSRTDASVRNYLIEKYNKLLRQYGYFDNYKAYRALGMIYLYNNIGYLALSNLEKAKRINPYDVKINSALAVYYAGLGNSQRAIKFFKAALKLNPFDRETYKNFALFYTQLGHIEEANRLIIKADSLNIF